MSTARTQRRLAAILAADVVGHSRLMGQDEAGMLTALKALRTELIDPKSPNTQGECSNPPVMDCLPSSPVLNAVACAVALQQRMTRRNINLSDRAIRPRSGLISCDIIVEDGDVFGDRGM